VFRGGVSDILTNFKGGKCKNKINVFIFVILFSSHLRLSQTQTHAVVLFRPKRSQCRFIHFTVEGMFVSRSRETLRLRLEGVR